MTMKIDNEQIYGDIKVRIRSNKKKLNDASIKATTSINFDSKN